MPKPHGTRPHGKTEAAASDKAVLRDWLMSLMRRYNVKEKQLADAGGVSVSTVYRWLDLEATTSPQAATLLRIARHFDAAAPGFGAASGFAEPEAARYEGEPPEPLAPRTPNQSVWRIGNRALELAGVLPGDLVLLDQAAPARAGDVVIAQIYDFETGSAETRIRQFDGYCLSTRSMDPRSQEKSIPVDGERAAIVGRVTRLFRMME